MKNELCKYGLIVSVIIFFIAPAYTTDYYIATYGNNSNDGLSVDTPKYNFNNSQWFNSSNVKPGDIVYVVDGTWYNESIMFSDLWGNKVYISGNSTHPITITAYNGTPTFDGWNGTFYAGRAAYFNDGSNNIYPYNKSGYIRISNITFRNYQWGVEFNFAQDVHISRLNLSNFYNYMVRFASVYNGSLKNSKLTNASLITYFENSYANTIQFITGWGSTSNIVISNNDVSENIGHGLIDVFNDGDKRNFTLSDITIDGNTLHDTPYTAVFTHWDGTNNYTFERINVTNNVIYRIWAPLYISLFRDSIISNNTIFDGRGTKENPTAGSYGITTFESNMCPSCSISSLIDGSFGEIQGNIIYNVIAPLDLNLNNNLVKVFLKNNNQSIYRVRAANAYIQNPLNSIFTVITDRNGKIYLNFTDNNVFSENGANTAYYYPDRSEYQTIGNETVMITAYPITIRPLSGYATISIKDPLFTMNATNVSDGIIINSSNSSYIVNIEFENNRVLSEVGASQPVYYPVKSNISLLNLGFTNITLYDLFAVPSNDYATIAVNDFNNSFVNFTANTTDGNNVNFTVSSLKPNINYRVKKDNTDFTTVQADSFGKIEFNNSVW